MRLIDADALLEEAWDVDCRCGYVQVVDVGSIEEAPTIEAKPVVHAHWEKYDDSEFCYCSHCGKPAAEDDDVSWHGYCPVCGALMDECVKIPVVSMEDVPKIMEEMEK